MSEENSLAVLTKANQMLAEVKNAFDAKRLMNMASAAEHYARKAKMSQEAINHAYTIRIDAQRMLGEFLKEAPKNTGSRGIGKSVVIDGNHTPKLADLGLTKKESMESQLLDTIADQDEALFHSIRNHEKTLAEATREMKWRDVRKNLEDIGNKKAKEIKGVYDVVVIDPPWPMERIERNVSPTEVGFDYPTMPLEEIKELKIPLADKSHVWLWTTHKFLPVAFELLKEWGTEYICTFVWHKAGGFQPFNLPQYNCEFALYARKGSPLFMEFTDFKVCFSADRGKHSEKPSEFYDLVRRVTAGRRLDMFNRREIEGFDRWGNGA